MGRCSGSRLARGLCVGSEVLLADEPTSELDEGNRGLVLAELRREADRGAVVVVATHDPAVVEACDRHYVLDDGVLVDHVATVDLGAWSRQSREQSERVVDRAGDRVGRQPRGPARRLRTRTTPRTPTTRTTPPSCVRATLHEPHAPGRLGPARARCSPCSC